MEGVRKTPRGSSEPPEALISRALRPTGPMATGRCRKAQGPGAARHGVRTRRALAADIHTMRVAVYHQELGAVMFRWGMGVLMVGVEL
jgi:hypothetical protein